MPFLPFPPTSVDGSIAVFRQDVNIAHDIVHGGIEDDVETEAGIVPSFAKVIAQFGTGVNVNLITTNSRTLTFNSSSHSKHYLCTNNDSISILLESPSTVDSTGTSVIVFVTQLGNGVITLSPAGGVTLVYPEDATPTTYGRGCTIAVMGIGNNKWLLAGNLGY